MKASRTRPRFISESDRLVSFCDAAYCSTLSLHCLQVVCDLIEEEAELLGGSEHVMLAGFSQGGALALHIAVHSGIQ